MARTIVLVVEDEPALGKRLVASLEEEGYKVFWARNADEALEAVKAQDVGLVFLDVLLPGGKNGFDILRKIKSDNKTKAVAVVMLSNMGELDGIDKAMELGANDYIVKASVDISRILEIAKEYVSG